MDGGYTIRNFDATGYAIKTNIPSNTAFRGFGGPEGAIVIETVMDHIAHHIKADPLQGKLYRYQYPLFEYPLLICHLVNF